MCLSQGREITEQCAIYLEILRMEEEVQRPGNGIVQKERGSKEEIVKCRELCT